jgi:hypothetical protein
MERPVHTTGTGVGVYVGTGSSIRKPEGSLDGDPELDGTQQPEEAVSMIRNQSRARLLPSSR